MCLAMHAIQTLRTSLPLGVRVSQFREDWQRTVDSLRSAGLCTPISWFDAKDCTAWKCSDAAYHHPENKSFVEFVKSANTMGTLTFQEEVSMLPPLLLDVRSDSVVLDMCAVTFLVQRFQLGTITCIKQAKLPLLHWFTCTLLCVSHHAPVLINGRSICCQIASSRPLHRF
eukprot:m.659956 g.659956  ORF g.659956 m.659956 type:complete len:171 (+) comp22728_c0_seq10:112-624(+)